MPGVGVRIAAILALALPALLPPAPVSARETPAAPDPAAVAAICDRVAVQVAAESGVPLDVLRAITRTETGRRIAGAFRPWPWTVNMEGKGVWFDSREEALAYARKHLARGARSFDMGCFQVNYKWHGENFDSLAAMMDPLTNARYAAKYLTELHAEKGDWLAAAGRYHSATPKYATRYARRFARLRAALQPVEDRLVTVPPPARPEPAITLALQTLPATPGAVTLSFRAPGTGLLRPARPLFD